jgi:hypothetical protein
MEPPLPGVFANSTHIGSPARLSAETASPTIFLTAIFCGQNAKAPR